MTTTEPTTALRNHLAAQGVSDAALDEVMPVLARSRLGIFTGRARVSRPMPPMDEPMKRFEVVQTDQGPAVRVDHPTVNPEWPWYLPDQRRFATWLDLRNPRKYHTPREDGS